MERLYRVVFEIIYYGVSYFLLCIEKYIVFIDIIINC